MSAFESGREFYVDPVTAQTFYREPANGGYSPWMPLKPSDYHLSRPEAHDVPTHALNRPGLVLADAIPTITSHTYGGFITQPPPSTQPPPLTQGYPASQVSSVEHGQPVAQPLLLSRGRSFSAPAAPAPQNPAESGRNSRRTQRLARSYDPVRGQRTGRLREGGRGRTRGAPNYKRQEVQVLLDLVEEELPIASKGWRVVGCQFRDWAVVAGYPARTDRSLELKYKQLVKTKKPTGDAECPPDVRRAHEIDHKLHSKVASRDLEDGEIMEFEDGDGNNSDDEMSDSYDPSKDDGEASPVPRRRPIPRVRTARAEGPLASQESVRQPSFKGTDLLEKISKTFDPEIQSRREADRASSMFQSQQLILLQSQIRDLNSTILSLRTQVDDTERRRVDADRRADRLQNQIDITSAVSRARLYRSATRVPRHVSPITISSSESTPDRNRRWEASFRDGGHSSWFGNVNRFDGDSDVVEVTRVPWSPPHSPARSPPPSDSE